MAILTLKILAPCAFSRIVRLGASLGQAAGARLGEGVSVRGEYARQRVSQGAEMAKTR